MTFNLDKPINALIYTFIADRTMLSKTTQTSVYLSTKSLLTDPGEKDENRNLDE